MSLILVKLSLEIVVDAATLGKDTAEMAKGFAEGEWARADVDGMEWVTSIMRLPHAGGMPCRTVTQTSDQS